MARSRGGGSARPAPRPTSSSTRSAPPPPAPAYSAPPPAPMQSSGGGGFMANMVSGVASGMAMGTGSAIAHRAVDAVMGPRTVVHEHAGAPAETASARPLAAQGEVCFNQKKAFSDCLENSGGDIARCQFYFDALEQCKKQGF